MVGFKRLVIEVNSDTWRKFKALCAYEDKNIPIVLDRILLEAIKKHEMRKGE